MTNVEIINNEAIKLAEAGIINYNEIGIPESLHTYAAWKKFGYQVRRGEKAKACIKIWKYKRFARENTDDTKDQLDKINTAKMFMTKAYFFTIGQVDKINK